MSVLNTRVVRENRDATQMISTMGQKPPCLNCCGFESQGGRLKDTFKENEVVISRSTRNAELILSGLDNSISPSEIAAAISAEAHLIINKGGLSIDWAGITVEKSMLDISVLTELTERTAASIVKSGHSFKMEQWKVKTPGRQMSANANQRDKYSDTEPMKELSGHPVPE
ncbi:hypothetical protein G5I_11575 [Acromyrmex echinatior]|uniref:Uncharacterized protein n=1 Tax=Acromyrmex echinatior TaxID=103372 RepID=F4WZZ6_ACREC|nr:hypothetical protein G5I_11575 [Acromyrmex echinatior]